MKPKAVKKYLRKYVKWWVGNTGLAYWNITVKYASGTEVKSDGSLRVGFCDVIWKYCSATITFFPKSMTNMDAQEIEAVVVHELMHVFLNEMRENDIDHEERVATMLQKAFYWVTANVGEKP